MVGRGRVLGRDDLYHDHGPTQEFPPAGRCKEESLVRRVPGEFRLPALSLSEAR